MASKKEKLFKNRFESNTTVGGLSKGQVSLHRILHIISTVPPPPPPPPRPSHHHQEEEEKLPVLNKVQTENKVILGIDLNSLPQDNDCDSPPAKIGGSATVSTVLVSKKVSSVHVISTVPPPPPRPSHQYHQEEEEKLNVLKDEQTENKVILDIDLNSLPQGNDCDSPLAKNGGSATASPVLESKNVSSVTACDLNFNENQEVSFAKNENEIQIQYCSEVETNGIDENDWRRQCARWGALLKMAEIYFRKLEEERKKDSRQARRRRRSGKVD